MKPNREISKPSSGSERHALIVSYQYPPVVTAGVYRMLGLSRKLLDEGWAVTALTIRESRFDSSDPHSVSMIPDGVNVIRTGSIDIVASMYRKPQIVELGKAGKVSARKSEPSSGSRFVQSTSRAIRSVIAAPFAFPDRRAGWTIPLIQATRKFLNAHPTAVVLSSSPPHSTQNALALLRKTMRFSWVADFRDPWTYPIRKPISRMARRAHQSMETAVLRSADHIIINTPGSREALLNHYAFLDTNRVTTVTNAYDPHHIEDPAPGAITDGDIAYFGEVYISRLDRYLEGLRVMRDRGVTLPVLDIYGRMPDNERRRIVDLGFENQIRFRGNLPYGQSLGAMRKVRSLLLLVSAGDGWKTSVPSKLYPYLFSGRPILAIGPDGDATDIVTQVGAGTAITSSSAETVADGIVTFLALRDAGSFAVDTVAAQRYHIDETGRQVSSILESVRR